MDEDFSAMQKAFFNKNCMQFEASEENKLVYTSIFKQYQETTEAHLMTVLAREIEDFSMETFMDQLTTRKDEIDEPLMDLLLSFSEFEQFKEMMLFARAHFVATTPKLKSGKAAALGLSNTASKASRTEETLMQASDLRHFEGCIDGLQVAGTATKVH